ncbi:MAG: hypothetical protein GC190_14085 [Alphaproteobacteria bacterium]|nr:hypothetical protein [Alphaproteobacteria bacterium]
MRRLLVITLCAIGSIAHNAAHADEEKNCTSIVERDCAALPRITAKGDLRVQIFTRKRELSFPVSSAVEDAEELSQVCNGGVCTCNENIEFLEFKGPHAGFRQVNTAEHTAAGRMRCSVENADVDRQITHFEVSKHLVSIAAFELEYCHTCGGSCHGTTALSTFDAETGQALSLREALKPGAIDALRRHMIDYIAKTYGTDVGERYIREQLSNELSQRALLDEGVYAERRTLYVNLDSFVLGCADGSFDPVPVPRDLIAPAFAALLD